MSDLLFPAKVIMETTAASARVDPLLWRGVQAGLFEVRFCISGTFTSSVPDFAYVSWVGKAGDTDDTITIGYRRENHYSKFESGPFMSKLALQVIEAREKIMVFRIEMKHLPPMIVRDVQGISDSMEQFWGEDGEWNEDAGEVMTITTAFMSAKELRDLPDWEP